MISQEAQASVGNWQEEVKKRRFELGLEEQDTIKINRICEEVTKIWKKTPPPYPYTPHDHTHCERVEEKIYQLLTTSELQKFSKIERFLLIASAWLHDIGMNPYALRKDPPWRRGMARTKSWNEETRKKHNERSSTFVEEKAKTLGLTDKDIKYLKKLCYFHRHRTYSELQKLDWETEDDKIHIKLLAAFLRLADALHIRDRFLVEQFQIYDALGLDPEARFHWLKSKFVHSILIDSKTHKITVLLRVPNTSKKCEKWIKPLRDLLELEAQDELDSLKDIFAEGAELGLPVYLSVKSGIQKSKMEEEEWSTLDETLNYLELFESVLSPNASAVITNIFKQIDLYLNLNDPTTVVDYLTDYEKDVLRPILDKRPCHVYLAKIDRLLIDVLKDEADATEKVERIKSTVQKWENDRESALETIPKIAYGTLAQGFPALLYGYSDTIVRCLAYILKEQKQSFKVYVCEGRTNTEYRYNNRIVFCDGIMYAEKLKEAEKTVNKALKRKKDNTLKINIQFVPDSAVSNLLTNKKISMILFGANGISPKGKVSHKLGHLAIADMAAGGKYATPIYVIAESMKIGLFEEKPDNQRENNWLTTDVHQEDKFEKIFNLSEGQGIKNLLYNPREDVVPPDRILKIITEKGPETPQEIWRHSEEELEMYKTLSYDGVVGMLDGIVEMLKQNANLLTGGQRIKLLTFLSHQI